MKLQLTESLLERLEQLKKAMGDIADLQKILSERESEIAYSVVVNSGQAGDSCAESKGLREIQRRTSTRWRDSEERFVERMISTGSYSKRIKSCASK